MTRSPFQRFFQTETAGGVLLLLCTSVAIVLANSRWSDSVQRFWDASITLTVAARAISLTLHQWINDGLMAVFFLLVGLEIKRELIAGELAMPRQAALPIAGAVGGMIVPAAIYWAFNSSGTESRGWGIPMATDIAFALGALSLIAPRAPTGAKVFLTAFAIVDDMGAVLVIALFYSNAIAWGAFAAAGGVLTTLVLMNVAGVRRLTPYLVLGLTLWFFVHESGLHATIAGVVLAFTIPTTTRINALEFSREAPAVIDEFDRTETGDLLVITSKGQQEALFALERASEDVTAPLLRLEHALHRFTAFIVMPLFALSNAGVSFGQSMPDLSVLIGTSLGLAVGKPLGITAAAYVAVRAGFASLPRDVSWSTLHALAWLGGIGFTMSLFIATLAFEGPDLLETAKMGIMAGSVSAGITGALAMRWARTRDSRQAPALADDSPS